METQGTYAQTTQTKPHKKHTQAPLRKRDTTPSKIEPGRNPIKDNHFRQGPRLPNTSNLLQANTRRGTRSRQTTKKNGIGRLNRVPTIGAMSPGPLVPLATQVWLAITTSNWLRRSSSQTNRGLLHLRFQTQTVPSHTPNSPTLPSVWRDKRKSRLNPTPRRTSPQQGSCKKWAARPSPTSLDTPSEN